MKTIAELQQEIRKLRKDINSIDTRLEMLDRELLNYKDAANDKSEYESVYQIAKVMPVINHPIVGESVSVKNNYFGILLMVATIDDSISEKQLLFLQRMVMSDPNNNRMDYYLGRLGTIQEENVLFQLKGEIKTGFAKQLVLDMLIIANLSNAQTRSAYKVIVDIAAFLNQDKYKIRDISLIASAVLRQDVSGLTNDFREIIYLNNLYGYYLLEMPAWEEKLKNAELLLEKERENCYAKKVSKTVYFHRSEKNDEDAWYDSREGLW